MKNTRLYLNVPYSEKDEAKTLGARWDSERKQWYVTYKKNYHLFKKWFFESDTNLIIYDYLYIVVANRECFRCKKQTPVISFASDTIIELADEDEDTNQTQIWDDAIHFIHDIDNPPEELKKHLREKYHFYHDYSKFSDSYYYANHCKHCGVLQGDFYLHSEPDSPFFLHDIDEAKELTLYKFKLEYDLELFASFSWSSTDYLIKEYSTIKDLVI